MSIQLKPDEMLELLAGYATDEPAPPHPRYGEFKRRVEALADEMAAAIAESLGVEQGCASFEGLAFAGTCVPFHPATHRQPCPPALAALDPGAVIDWNEQAAEVPETDSDLVEAAEGAPCAACGRPSVDCSRDPCAAVLRDRAATFRADVVALDSGMDPDLVREIAASADELEKQADALDGGPQA